jgi:hypothetical protein
MPLPIYSTWYLNGLVERIVPAPKFFLDRYFPEEKTSESEEVYFDIEEGQYDIAPFVHPLIGGKLITSQGYKTKSFKPAYVKPKAVLTPDKGFTRMAGEPFGGQLSPDQRAAMHLMKETTRLVDGLSNRLEVMAAEVCKTGKLTIRGEGYDTVLDFQRHSSLTEKLKDKQLWSNKELPMTAFLEGIKRRVASKSNKKTRPRDLILGTEAFDAFIANAEVRETAPNFIRGADTSIQLTPGTQSDDTAVFKGRYGDLNIWMHEGRYQENGVEYDFISPKDALFMAPGIRGVRHFGAIQDLKALQARPMFIKSWEEEDPSVRIVLLQSAPVLVPYDVNAACLLTVL